MTDNEAPAPPHPRTVAFWVARIFLGALLVLIGWCGWRIALHLIGGSTDRLIRESDKSVNSDTAPKPVDNAVAVKRMRAEVAALDSEIVAAKEAHARQVVSANSRTISREDDRKETARLNQVVLDLQRKRAELAAALAEREP